MRIRNFENIDEIIPSALQDVAESFKHIKKDIHLKDKELLPEGNKRYVNTENIVLESLKGKLVQCPMIVILLNIIMYCLNGRFALKSSKE